MLTGRPEPGVTVFGPVWFTTGWVAILTRVIKTTSGKSQLVSKGSQYTSHTQQDYPVYRKDLWSSCLPFSTISTGRKKHYCHSHLAFRSKFLYCPAENIERQQVVPVLNFLGHCHERLLHIGGTFCTCLKKFDSQFIGIGL